jgi:hypothetical protein
MPNRPALFEDAGRALILTDGQINSLLRFRIDPACPALARKISNFRFFGIYDLLSSVPLRRRGVRVVTNVERNAVDARALTDERRSLRTAKSCGPGAPKSGAKLATMLIASRR